jgi:RNA polymerase sigma factor (sigma-70 family)
MSTLMNSECDNITIESIVANYGRLVKSISRRMIQDPVSVEDAVQEVWIEVLKSLSTFRNDSRLSTWLYAIASRTVLRYAMKERHYSTKFLSDYFHGDVLELPYHEDFDKHIWVREMCDKCLTGVLHCLDNESRLIFIFRDIAQLPYGEIAEIMEKDEDAVRKAVSRSRRKLRSFLNNECVLDNPESSCKCRMSKWVKEINLQNEYKKLQQSVTRINFFKASEMILPQKKYWENYI